jgi:hypothetical protein
VGDESGALPCSGARHRVGETPRCPFLTFYAHMTLLDHTEEKSCKNEPGMYLNFTIEA